MTRRRLTKTDFLIALLVVLAQQLLDLAFQDLQLGDFLVDPLFRGGHQVLAQL